MKIAALFMALAFPIGASPIYSIMESNNFVVAPANFWTNQPNDTLFSNAVNAVVVAPGGNATNVVIRPGVGIIITTNVNGSDYSVSWITNYSDPVSFNNALNVFAGSGASLTDIRGQNVGIFFSGPGVTETIDGNGNKHESISGGTNGGSGSVTSVGLIVPSIFTLSGSPITAAGSMTIGIANQNNNFVWASPNGSAGQPTFRPLVANDIPSLTVAKISDAGTAARAAITDFVSSPTNSGTDGQVLSKTGGKNKWINSGSGSGSVTSVALTAPAFFSVGGSPVTTSGTLAISANNQSANTFLGGATSGGASVPAFRALVLADIPTIPTANISGLGTDAYSNAVDTPFLATVNTFTTTNVFTSVVIVTQVVAQNLFIATNVQPAAAQSPGGAAFWNSNGVVYLLTSAPGSTTWAAATKVGP